MRRRYRRATATTLLIGLLATTGAFGATEDEQPRAESDDAKLLRRARRELIAGAVLLALGGLMSTYGVVAGTVGIVGPSDCVECQGTPATPGFISERTRGQLITSAAVIGVIGHAAMFTGITSLGWSASHKHRVLYGSAAPTFEGSRLAGAMGSVILRF